MKINFPKYANIRCLMMPYVQGDPDSVPPKYRSYETILENVYLGRGDIGYLTIDESIAYKGKPHRGARAQFKRALHTEAGRRQEVFRWGDTTHWGKGEEVTLDRDVRVLLSNSLDDSCAIWDAEHEDTTIDGDIGHLAGQYPYEDATFMKAGEVHEIGILTPHESLPVEKDTARQFLRIVGSGVHGREHYFTRNPLMEIE